MERIKFTDLPFYERLWNLAEAMQYSLSDYHALNEKSSKYQKDNHKYWVGELEQLLNRNSYALIVEFKQKYAAEIAQNPLLEGVIDMYLKAYEGKNEEDYKKAYEDFQAIQKNHPVEEHMQDYVDMGCILMNGYLEETSKIKLTYPMTLYTAYTMHGGMDDDTRGGYLFPLHELTDEQVLQLHETNPELFKSEKIKKLYDKIAENHKKPSQPGEE